MKVAMYYSNRDVRIEEMPVPEIGQDEILIKIKASGICGSDIMEWYRKDKVPLVLGHEIAGEIAEAGSKVKGFKTGQRVSASHHVPCNECYWCLNGHSSACEMLRSTKFYPGGFAEYVKIPAINIEKKGVYPLPDNVSSIDGSFSEPIACVMRAQRLAGMKEGKTVLVIGSGISGLLHVMLARVNGASKIMATDVVEMKLNKAKEIGADLSLNAKEYKPQAIKDINKGRLADLVILCAGELSAFQQAVDSIEKGGTLLIFSAIKNNAEIPLQANKLFWRNEITITSSYANHPEEQKQAIELMSRGVMPVDKLVTHRFGLADTEKGFRLMEEGRDCIKVIIEPHK